jgi:hypothetical protein
MNKMEEWQNQFHATGITARTGLEARYCRGRPDRLVELAEIANCKADWPRPRHGKMHEKMHEKHRNVFAVLLCSGIAVLGPCTRTRSRSPLCTN